MKIGTSIYKALFIASIILQMVITSFEFIYLFNMGLVILFLVDKKNIISKSTSTIIYFLTFILCIGLLISLFNNTELYNKVKDILHFSKPILAILSGYLLTKKIKNKAFIIKTFIVLGSFFAVYHISKFAFIELKKDTIEEIRLRIGSRNFIELIALILLIAYRKNVYVIKSTLSKNTLIILLSISITLYFSRTMLMGVLLFLSSVFSFTKLSKKTIEYSTLFLIFGGLFYGYLFTLDLDPDRKGINSFLFKIRNAPAEIFYSPHTYDPNNHRKIFNHWRAYEVKKAFLEMEKTPLSFITGKGFGTLVDLGFKAPIGGVNGLRYIPILHNSYAYVFLKTGILGFICYIILLVNLYRFIYKKHTSEEENMLLKIISGFGLYFIATSFVVSGMYNLEEISVFCLGFFLYLIHQEKQQNNNILNE